MNTFTATETTMNGFLLGWKRFKRPTPEPLTNQEVLERIDLLLKIARVNLIKQYTYCPDACHPFHKSGLYSKETKDIVIVIEASGTDLTILREEFDALIKIGNEIVKNREFILNANLLTVNK